LNPKKLFFWDGRSILEKHVLYALTAGAGRNREPLNYRAGGETVPVRFTTESSCAPHSGVAAWSASTAADPGEKSKSAQKTRFRLFCSVRCPAVYLSPPRRPPRPGHGWANQPIDQTRWEQRIVRPATRENKKAKQNRHIVTFSLLSLSPPLFSLISVSGIFFISKMSSLSLHLRLYIHPPS
jgi:hypothetical protein